MSSVELIAQGLKKQFGEGLVTLATELPDVDIVSSGSLTVDYATGVGGIPRGTFVEILAEESVGKTSLAYDTIAAAQNVGLRTLFINLEGKFDLSWAETISGLNGKDLLLASPEPGMQTVHFLQTAVHSGEFGHIVLDSVGAMINDSEVFNKDGKPGKIQQGGAASLVTSMITRTMTYARKNGTTVVFLNQLRDTMGSLFPMQHGPGGRAIRHAAGIRIRMKAMNAATDKIKAKIDGDDIVVARRISAEMIKNKVGPPNSVAFYMFYNRELDGIGPGIDKVGEIIDLSMKTGVIRRGGGTYYHDSFPDGKVKSKDEVREFLRSHSESFEIVRNEIIQFARDKRRSNVTEEEE